MAVNSHIESSAGWAVGLIHRTEEEETPGRLQRIQHPVRQGRGLQLRQHARCLRDRISMTLRVSASPTLHHPAVAAFCHAGGGRIRGDRIRRTEFGRALDLARRRVRSTTSTTASASRSKPASIGRRAIRSAPMGIFGRSRSRRRFRAAEVFQPPVLRAFVTYARWSDDFKGRVGGTAYENATEACPMEFRPRRGGDDPARPIPDA